MALVTPQTRLADVIVAEPSVIPVVNRFGISLGVGDKTTDEICRERGIDVNFFLTIINAYIFESFYPDKHFRSFGAREVIDYLRQTNESYVRNQLPNIERHFNALISRSNSANNLSLLFDLYKEVRTAIEQRIADDVPWFDRILHQESNLDASAIQINPDDVNADNDDDISDTLDDLVNMFVIHLRGDYDANLCHAVLFAIISLKKDICQNNRIRNRVLYPLSKAIDNAYNK